MFNISQLYSIFQFLRVNFHKVDNNELAFITMKKKTKRFLPLRSRFLQNISGKYKHLQRKVDQWLVSAAI